LVNRIISRRKFLQTSAAVTGAAMTYGALGRSVVRAQEPMPKFVWSPKATNNPVFAVAEAGGRIRSNELGVDFQWVGPANTDAVEQANLLDAAITAGCDGMGISCNDAAVLLPIIDRAIAQGIPVITWDSDSSESQRLSFYSFETQSAATAGAQRFAEVLATNPTKTYVLLSGNAGAPNLEERIAAVQSVLQAEGSGLEFVTTLFCNDDAVLGATLIEDQLTAMPDLGGIFMIGGWPLFGDVNAMPQFLAATAAGTLKCVAWDTLWMQLPLLENGTVQGLIGQKYFGWGYDGIGIMYDHVVHGIQLPDFIDSGYDLLKTPEDAVAFATKWDAANIGKPEWNPNFVPEGGGKFGKGDASAYTSGSASPAM
jgi:ribose transport system substrate-binding protein